MPTRTLLLLTALLLGSGLAAAPQAPAGKGAKGQDRAAIQAEKARIEALKARLKTDGKAAKAADKAALAQAKEKLKTLKAARQ